MSTINTAALDLQSSATTNANNAAAKKTDPANKDMFLKLLVAQLKNQDPLAPQDGAQFVAQLAQFNSLEQLSSINDRIGMLIADKSKS